MKKVRGTFDGTAATINVGLGFVPDRVLLMNVGDGNAAFPHIIWDNNMRVAANVEGILLTPNAPLADYTAGQGISPYYGGDKIVTAAETHLVKDPAPNKIGNVLTWTLNTSANRTGKFNIEKAALVVAGSRILINQGTPGSVAKWYTIEAITSDGEQDDEVTLNYAAPSGQVLYISGAFDFIAAAAGVIMPKGFTLAATGTVNVNSEMIAFEAEAND
jgi:hypothetical protein